MVVADTVVLNAQRGQGDKTMSNPIWLEHAFKDKDVHEIRGGENPRIIEMGSYTTLKPKEDEIPWCSDAVCAWMEECGIPSTKSAAAKSWLEWGIALNEPRVGCVCVIQQKTTGQDKATGSSSGYHVALLLDVDADYVYLFGGNQSDRVKKSAFPLSKYRICGYRWPSDIK